MSDEPGRVLGDDECGDCGAPIVCLICDTCAEHCISDGDPEACWQAHEDWRLGRGDPSFDAGATVRHPPQGSVGPAPRPRWRS